MTFARFEQMPDDGHRYELRDGEPIPIPRRPHERFKIQQQLRERLVSAVGSAGKVGTEWGFRVNEDNYFVADVAYLSKSRWDAIDRYLTGAPELVVEVLSPSNSAAEMADKEFLCLENGCREFWLIDPKRQTVRVSTPDGLARTYKTGQRVPLMFGGELAVSDIFE
jgi:Uma2 family endonuclease